MIEPSIGCKDCRHVLDIGHPSEHCGRYVCAARQLQSLASVWVDKSGRAHRNLTTNAQACRDLAPLCGQQAAWFETKQ